MEIFSHSGILPPFVFENSQSMLIFFTLILISLLTPLAAVATDIPMRKGILLVHIIITNINFCLWVDGL